MESAFIAIDWGTTQRRLLVIEADGSVSAVERGPGINLTHGIDFEQELSQLRRRYGNLPVICAGMVGSNRGWIDAGYVNTPASVSDISARIHWVIPNTLGIIPGVAHRTDSWVDVMRGEEVQILGALTGRDGISDGELCLPGTHCKWVKVENRRIVELRTAMTGELFALLRDQSTLNDVIAETDASAPGFRAGIEDAGNHSLLSLAFQARAWRAAKERGPRAEPGYVSGLLIGEDVRSNLYQGTAPVMIIGETKLCALYGAAIGYQGRQWSTLDGLEAFTLGITEIWRAAR